MKKAILSLFTALTMLILFSACGGNKSNEKTKIKTDTDVSVSVSASASNSESLNIDANTEVTTPETTEPMDIDITDKFTDEKFLTYVRELVNKTDGDPIYLKDVSEIKKIDYSPWPQSATEKALTSLDGIEYFTSLETLNIGENQLTMLDLSKNTSLKTVHAVLNQLAALDTSNNTELEQLTCSSNKLTTLDISKNTKLTYLNCEDNQLTTLDVSNNPELITLLLNSNQLTTLDVSNNPELEELQVMNNQLTTLNLSNNPKINEHSFIPHDDGVAVKYYNADNSSTVS